jgi:hypothetical protein
MAREAFIQRDILAAWGAHPQLRLVRMNTGAAMVRGQLVRFGLPGMADIMGLIKGGRALAIEVKTATGRQREAQKTFERVFTEWGGLYILARSVDDVDRGLAAVGITR